MNSRTPEKGRRKAKKQVHPAASAVLILVALGAVQWVWWRFLVWKAPPGPGGGVNAGARTGLTVEARLPGRADVIVKTVGGSDQPGSADGPPHAARFDRPTGLALDGHGNLFVADTGNDRIRMISAAGDVTTVAGGEPGFTDGPVAQARFKAPCGICIGSDGSVYIADTGNHSVRRIKDGQVSTVAGVPPGGTAAKPGAVMGPITGVSIAPPTGTGGAVTVAPVLVVADPGSGQLRRFTMEGAVLPSRSIASGPVAVAAGSEAAASPGAGNLVLGAQVLHNVSFNATDDVPAAKTATVMLRHPVGLFPMGRGWLVTDSGHGAVVLVVNGKARVIAGTCTNLSPQRGFRDGGGNEALFGTLSGIVADNKRYVYVADTGNNCVRRLDISEVPRP